jgi:Zn-finger nucleic acid-binding protein
MRRVQVGPTALLECAACGGVWLDAAAFERVCADGDAQAAVLGVRPQLYTTTGSEPGPVRYRPCPSCGRMMNRVNFAKISGTVVDVCKGHGTFLDSGELHQIVTFIRSGGLERARQRQLDDLKEAERDLRATQQAEAIRSASLPDASRDMRWNGPDLLELLRRLRT